MLWVCARATPQTNSNPRVGRHGRWAILKLKADLWRVPFAMCVAAILLFMLTIRLDRLALEGWLSLPKWVSVGGPADARAVLTAMLGAVSTVLALIFSVALLVLSMAASQFGPRILQRFLRDGITQMTIGFFLASFVHCLLTTIVTRDDTLGGRFVPQLTVMCSIVLVIASFVFLVLFSHRVSVSIQTQNVVANIVADLNEAQADLAASRIRLRKLVPPAKALARRASLMEQCAAEGAVVTSGKTGFVERVDVEGLVNAASAADAVVRLLHRPGQFVMKGAALLQVLPASKTDMLSEAARRTVKIAKHRTLEQDLEFATTQLVEIALRALSSAINDTFTGLTCIDWLGDEVRAFAACPPPTGAFQDPGGTLRVLWSPLRFERLVKTAFDQIREAAVGNPAVSIRLLQTFKRLAHQIDNSEMRGALIRQVEAIWESVCSQQLVALDKADIEAAYRAAHEALAAKHNHENAPLSMTAAGTGS